MSFFTKYAEFLGLPQLSPLGFYGSLTTILLASILIGLVAQLWKHKSGGIWAIAAIIILTGTWILALRDLDPTLYTTSWGGERGWGSLAAAVAVCGFVAAFIALVFVPSRRRTPSRKSSPISRSDPEIGTGPSLLDEPMKPILPVAPRHTFRQRLFIPMVILGLIVFIGAGILSVEKRQLDIFLRSVGLMEAPPKKVAAKKKTKPGKAQKKPKLPPSDPEVAQTQRLLADLGYKVGAQNGVIGAQTDEAIRVFQGHEGLPRSGKTSAELTERLKQAKITRNLIAGKTQLTEDYDPHADMCKRGIRAWYRSRTTGLSFDGTTQKIEKLEAIITVWFSYPGEDMKRVRASAICNYSRYREEMPEQPFGVKIVTGEAVEILSDREIGCFSEGQPC